MDWKDEAKELRFNKSKTWNEIANIIQQKYFQEETTLQVLEKVRSFIRRSKEYKNKDVAEVDINKVLFDMLQKGATESDILSILNISKRVLEAMLEDLKADGYNLEVVNGIYKIRKDIAPTDNRHTENWNGDKIIRFGSVSDTHLCSKCQQLTHLETLYDIFQREGIETVYHSGDITEGYKMRVGHEYDVFSHGADEQVQYVVDNYPYRQGIKTKFIIGNHDCSFIKSAGIDIGVKISKERKDMIYLGNSNAKIKLTPNCVLELNHPLDGASYALSYTLQKLIDSMSGGEKPNILLNGHHHKAMYLFYRNIHAFECGTLEAQTPFMRGKRIAAHMGGWIIEVHVNEEGTITRCKQEFIPFYNAIAGDY